MFRTVELPLWLLVLILLFAAVTFASHFLFPSVRWFLRRRAERLVAELNRRLHRPIQPFKLLNRTDMIQRLIDRGHAYVSGGAVYFDVSTVENFGQVSHYSRERMIELALLQDHARGLVITRSADNRQALRRAGDQHENADA